MLPSTLESTDAMFAMNRLEFGNKEQELEPLAAPPYHFFQNEGSYHICFNMYGIPGSSIRVGLNNRTRQFTVFAEKQRKLFTDQYLWLFHLPENAALDEMESVYKKGVVQFTFPKSELRPVGGAA